MLIQPPQQIGYYVDREFDCRAAIRPIFLDAIAKESEQFLDTVRLIGSLAAPALEAGWSMRDIQSAVHTLVAEMQTGTEGNITIVSGK